jgi:hypothetical protein
MRKKTIVCLGAVLTMLLSHGVASGQNNLSTEQKQPKEPAEVKDDRFLAQLTELQSSVMSIMRKAQFNGDLQTALGAASEARSNLELMAALTGRLPIAGPPAQNASRNIYLIAFKDHVIRAVLDYSVEGTTLSYLTLQGTRAQAPLDSVDREFSEQLNRERNVEFRLPPAK